MVKKTLAGMMVLPLLLAAPVQASDAGDLALSSYLSSDTPGPRDLPGVMQSVLLDAQERIRLKTGVTPRADALRVYSWPQVWPDGTLGLGGIGTQAVTVAQTTMVYDPGSKLTLEYRDRYFVSMQ